MTLLFAGVRLWEPATVTGALLIAHVVSLWPFYAPRPRDGAQDRALRFLSANLWDRNEQFQSVLDFVHSEAPDIAVFLEVNDAWDRALSALRDAWPHSHTEAPHWNRGIAIYSKLPFEDIQVKLLTDAVPTILVRVNLHGTALTIVAAHPLPPVSAAMSAARDMQCAELAALIAEMYGPTILIGDLNMTSWSPAFGDLIRRTRLRDSRHGLGIQPTWPSFLPKVFRIPLDHCLVSPAVRVVDRRIGPHIGSDHLPILIDMAAIGGK